MIPYEEYLPLLPHEYSYAQYLSYGFDLCMYDPMILKMVSEQYPREENYASDAISDSELVTYEDLGDDEDGIPPWLFADLEEEDASSIQQENHPLEIVFGSFDKNPNLDMVAAVPFLTIEPEFAETTVKIGEIRCPVAAFKLKIKNDDASQFMDLESNTVNLQSNTSEEIATECEFNVSDRNNQTNDEVRMALSKISSTFAKEEIIIDLENSSTMFSGINPLTCVFINNHATRYSDNLIFEVLSSVHLTWLDFVFPTPNLVTECDFAEKAPPQVATSIFNNNSPSRCASFVYGLATTASPPKMTTERDLVEKKTPQLFIFDPGEISTYIPFDFTFATPDLGVSFVGDGNVAESIESRRKQEVVLSSTCPISANPSGHQIHNFNPGGNLTSVRFAVVRCHFSPPFSMVPEHISLLHHTHSRRELGSFRFGLGPFDVTIEHSVPFGLVYFAGAIWVTTLCWTDHSPRLFWAKEFPP